MDKEFEDQVRKGLELARNRSYRKLGQLDRLRGLTLVEKRLISSPERSPTYFGQAIQALMWEAIDSQKPPFPEDLNSPPWRKYVLLQDYFKRGLEWSTVADRLGIAQSAYQELKREAAELIAAVLWRWEEETRTGAAVKDNLRPPPFVQYVKRHNYNPWAEKPIVQRYSQDDDLAEIIIEVLSGKPWVIVLDGAPGVGKTALAYEVARRCKERALFEAVIWTSAKKKMLVVQSARFAQVPYVNPITSPEDILDTIAHVLGTREVSSPQGYTHKVEIVNELLRTRNCLMVIDNLEDLRDEAIDQLSAFLSQYRGPSKALLTSRHVRPVGEMLIRLPGMSFEEAKKLMQLQCEILSLDQLSEEQQRLLYDRTHGNPLAMNLILGLSRHAGYPTSRALEVFLADQVALDHMLGTAYEKLDVEDKEVLHTMPIFTPFSASEQAICAASGQKLHTVRTSLGILYSLKMIEKADSRYLLPVLVFRFLEQLGEAPVNTMSLSPYTARSYANLAKYYIDTLHGMSTTDQRLRFLAEGQGDEKWNILATLTGCRALAVSEQDFELDGCRPHDAWRYVIDLFDLIGEPLGIMWYLEERLRWAEEAIAGCDILGDERKAAWFKVFDIGWTYLWMDEESEAAEIFNQNLNLAREKRYSDVEALALYNLARMAHEKGELEKASSLYTQALALWLDCGAPYQAWVAHTKSALGLVRYRQERLTEAKVLLEEALELRREMGRISEVIEGLSEVALAFAALDNLSDALQYSDKAMYLGEQIEPPSAAYAYALRLRAEIEEHLDRKEQAVKYLRKSRDIYRSLGAKHALSLTKENLERLEAEQASDTE